jgi:deaminated glutathione amidase
MRAALLQMCSGIDPAANSLILCDAIKEAAAGEALILFTPEMCGILDRDRARAASNIRSEGDDLVLPSVCEAARESGIWVSIGSLAIRSNENDLYANRSFLIDDQGQIRARYNKMHLFDVDLPTGESWRESSAYAAGKGPVLATGPNGTQIGLTICYDLRFPALYAALSQAGAQIITIPAAFTVPTGKAHWHTLIRARAIENACWIVAAAQRGTHEDGRATYGHSLVVNPWGEVILDMDEGSGLGFADIDLNTIIETRNRIPVINHRRDIGAVEVCT